MLFANYIKQWNIYAVLINVEIGKSQLRGQFDIIE